MKGLHAVLQRLLAGLAVEVCRRPRTVLGLAGLAAAAAAYLSAFHLGVLNDTNALIDPKSPVLRYYLDYLKEFDTKDPMVVVLQGDDFEKNRAAADALAGPLRALPGVREVYYRNDLSKLKPHFLKYESLDRLQGILEQIRNQRSLLAKGTGGVSLNSLLDEGLGQFEELEKKRGGGGSLDGMSLYADRMVRELESLAKELSRPLAAGPATVSAMSEEEAEFERQLRLNEYLSFEDGRMVMLLLIPGSGDPASFSPHEKTIRAVRDILQATAPGHPGVRFGLTGEPVLMDDELKLSTKDMAIASSVAFVLISALFVVSYREIVRPLLAIASLLCALVWSLGFTVLTIGHLNIISQAFVLMLLGLGIDFGIQMLGRYEEERSKGLDVEAALAAALSSTGLAVLTGGGITAAAFFTMCFNEFRGLVELGVIAGSGILFCIVANLVVLPALLAWVDRRRHAVPDHFHRDARFGQRIEAAVFSRPRLALALAALVTVVSVVQIPRVRFDYNLLNLQSPGLESVRLAEYLSTTPALSFLYGVLVADDLDQARAKAARLESLPTVAGVNSPSKILPEGQPEKLTILAQIRRELDALRLPTGGSGRVDVVRARQQLDRLLTMSREGRTQAAKFRQADKRAAQAVEIFDRMIPILQQSVDALAALPAEEASRRLNRYQNELAGRMRREFEFLGKFDFAGQVTLTDLPPEALRRYISPSGKVLIEVNPRENVWDRDANERFVRDLRSVDPRATGTPVQNYTYIEVLKTSYVDAALWAFSAIVVLVFLHFLRPGPTLLTLLPLALGVVWTLGVMGWTGLPFNPANIITLPLIIGIGVAFGVYVVDRHREEGRVAVFTSSTGKAVVLSAATTVIGFGSMMLGEYRGLVSLGLLMSIGISFCFLASVLVLPQILVLADRRKNIRPKV
jgi:hopanoid biosynthesis associated RND transporter like protein HpnN